LAFHVGHFIGFGQADTQSSNLIAVIESAQYVCSILLRSTTGIRKDGNLARLRHDPSDDDDDNNTWNGNSTQQM
jgi:hypothetical protein